MNITINVLEGRLRDLRSKMRAATTTREKVIYSEAVVHCIEDIRRYHRKKRYSIVQKIIAAIFFVALIGFVLFLVSLLKGESLEYPTIGNAVTENWGSSR